MMRVVVSKDAEKIRQNKSTSYDLRSQYEVDLLNYAENKDKHGNYSEFIKRCVAFYRDHHDKQIQVAPVQVSPQREIEVNTEGFL